MTCPSCTTAAANPLSGLYHSGCPECQARALAQSPGYHASLVLRRMAPEYAAALRAVAGDEVAARDALHRKVREWDQRITDARGSAQ
jgi:hypothetical protein